MSPLQDLLNDIEHQASPLLAPRPMAHSRELLTSLPPLRRHWGPRIWYRCLELASPGEKKEGQQTVV